MRPMFQVLVAGAVVLASTAAWAIEGSYAGFQDAARANVSCAWNIRGEGRGATSFEVFTGNADFNAEGWSTYTGIVRVKPGPYGAASGYLYLYMPQLSASQTVYRAGVNTRKLDAKSASGWLSQFSDYFNQIVSITDTTETRKYHPVLGNSTFSSAVATGKGRVFRNFTLYNVDQKLSFKGTVADGPNAGRAISGSVTLKARNCPREVPQKR